MSITTTLNCFWWHITGFQRFKIISYHQIFFNWNKLELIYCIILHSTYAFTLHNLAEIEGNFSPALLKIWRKDKLRIATHHISITYHVPTRTKTVLWLRINFNNEVDRLLVNSACGRQVSDSGDYSRRHRQRIYMEVHGVHQTIH